MGELHMRRIRKRLHEIFDGQIDLADWSSHSASTQEDVFLTRALAAYALMMYSGLEAGEAARSVTDGANDNGIDALHFDPREKVLYLVQSKWINNGNGSPTQAEVQTFINGFHDLVHEAFDRFNDKCQARKGTIQAALDDANVRIKLLFVHTGQSELGLHAKRRLGDLLQEVNDPAEVVSYAVLQQRDVHAYLASEAEGPPIDLDVTMTEWGTIQDPNVAYYGQVSAKDLADWYTTHGPRLFARNLRHLIPDSDVNDSIVETLKLQPEYFWYFNNGVTVVCDSIHKKPRRGADRRIGEFECTGVSVVNGAQTVGCIGLVAQTEAEVLEKALVPVRFISVGSLGGEFAPRVTRATNTQNRIIPRDFVALDKQQARLQAELGLDNIRYSYKTGEVDPAPDEGCSVVDGSIALACAQADVDLSVLAKREVGRLWQDIQRPPYTDLFNEGLSAQRLWRCVQVMRAVDEGLDDIQRAAEGRVRGVTVHGNRHVLHLVLQRIESRRFDEARLNIGEVLRQARELVPIIVAQLVVEIEKEYPTSYPASLFKNVTKCRHLAQQITTFLDGQA